MEVIYRRCAGLDVHKKTVMVCVRHLSDGGNVTQRIREFGTMTHDLRNLRSWLSAQGVTHIAMESTGVYWKPIWNVLEEGSFELLLCNAHDIKHVPGRKTDVKDCEWIARLLQHGLLRGSFVPSRGLRDLRDLTRARAKIVDEKTRHANRIQKVLEDANLKLTSVASDALGVSGRSMIEAIITGQEDPKALADLARRRLRGKIPHLRLALDGAITGHHRFMLRLHYDQVVHLEGVIAELDERIADITGTAVEALVRDDNLLLFPDATEDAPEDGPPDPPPDGASPQPASCPKERAKEREQPPSSSSPEGTTNSACAFSGVYLAPAIALLSTIPGVGQRTAENILAETGDDMSRFPTAGHFASWSGLCPGNNKSAGKSKKSTKNTGNNFLRRALTQAAWAAAHTKDTYLSAQYKRLAGRRGKKRAIVAVAHSILVAIYHMLERGVVYEDLGNEYFERLNADGLTRYHVARLNKLGYDVTLDKPESIPA